MRIRLSVVSASAAAVVMSVGVGAQFSSRQPPSLSTSRPFLAQAQGPLTIAMPDGSTLSGASNQLLLFFSAEASTLNQQAVASEITSSGAQVVGEIAEIRMLQVQIPSPATAGVLMVKLQTMAGVAHVGPNLFEAADDSACDGGGLVGPIPGAGPTGWVQAGRLAPPPASANDVIIGIIDDFAVPGQAPPPGVAPQHGDVVAAYAMDAGGKNAFQLGRNVFEIPARPTSGETYEKAVRELIATNPGKKIVLNLSRGPGQCNKGVSPDLRSTDPERLARARAVCAAARNAFDKSNNRFAQSLVRQYGDRVILVNSAGNIDVSLEPATSLSSCHFIPVGGFDQTSPAPTPATFTTRGAPIPVYAPACNISPVSLTVPPNTPLSSGTSFAAPQIAGQLAAIWASNPGLSACQLGSQVFALPKLDPTETGAQFNGQALAERAASRQPVLQPPASPLDPLPCPKISVTPSQSLLQVNQTVRLTPALVGGGTTTFKYLSSNPSMASVDASGVVTVKATGVATVSVTAPNALCAAQASIVVPSETYAGTSSLQTTATLAPNSGWTPNPLTVTGTVNGAPIRLVVAQSLLTAGTFAGFLTLGPGTITVSIPAQTCVACDPPLTVPGLTQNAPLPVSTSPITGTTDGRIIRIPVVGYPPVTGTVSVLGPTVQVTLDWNFQTGDGAGGVIKLQLAASLTKQ